MRGMMLDLIIQHHPTRFYMAGMEGFEPSHTEPESAVLPLDDIPIKITVGWAGRIRTPGCQDQNLVPYRLATAQLNTGGEGGIRTLGRLLTYTRLAGVHLKPARSPLLAI